MQIFLITHIIEKIQIRLGAELVFAMCEEWEIEVVIVNQSPEEITFEQELVPDMTLVNHCIFSSSVWFTLQEK